MATLQVSLDEYLRTSYRPDCDFLDGELEERNVGEKDHSAVQGFFIVWFAMHLHEFKLEGFAELRMRVSEHQVRVADVAVLRVDEPYEGVLKKPPLAVIEVLSPEDRLYRYESRLRDYRRFGIPHILVVDPQRRGAFDCSAEAWLPVNSFVMSQPAATIPLDELWKKLDSLHA